MVTVIVIIFSNVHIFYLQLSFNAIHKMYLNKVGVLLVTK